MLTIESIKDIGETFFLNIFKMRNVPKGINGMITKMEYLNKLYFLGGVSFSIKNAKGP